MSNLDTDSVATVWWKRNSDGLEFNVIILTYLLQCNNTYIIVVNVDKVALSIKTPLLQSQWSDITLLFVILIVFCRRIIFGLQDEEATNAVAGVPVDSSQTNYLNLDSSLTKSDDTFTCLIEVTATETAEFIITLNTFSGCHFG